MLPSRQRRALLNFHKCATAHSRRAGMRILQSWLRNRLCNPNVNSPVTHMDFRVSSLSRATSKPSSDVRVNRLLAALSDRSRRQFLASCDYVHLNLSEVLCNRGEKINYVYFPLDSFISLVTALDDGEKLEVGIVGDEGMLGMSLIL